MTKLAGELITRTLTTRRLGRPVLIFEQVGSTNDVAAEQARAGAADGLLVVAEEQIAGRGRLDRSWWAPPGTCLLMSLLLRPLPPFALHRAGQLTMCLGLGAVEGIEEVTGVKARLKWPNDIVLGGRKLGGMLTELSARDDELDYAVLGLGLNVNLEFTQPGAPAELAWTATSLQIESGRAVDRVSLLAAILARTEQWYDRVLSDESPHEAWAERLETLGRRVRVSLVDGWIEGIAAGVTPEGGLIVEDERGTPHTVWSGDVTAVR